MVAPKTMTAAQAHGPLSNRTSDCISWVRQSGEDVAIRPKLNPEFFRTPTGIAVLIITAVVLLTP